MDGRQAGGDGCRGRAADWMAPTAGAHTDLEASCVGDVIDDVIGPSSVGAVDARRDVIEIEAVASAPRHVVIGTTGVAADANRTDELLLRVIESKAAAEDVDAPDFAAEHGIVGLAIVGGIAAIGNARVYGIAGLQAEEAATGLHGCVEISGGERKSRKAEGVGGVGFLGGDDAATRPLVGAGGTGEGDGADDAVAVDDCGPHVEAETPVGSSLGRGEGSVQGAMRRE